MPHRASASALAACTLGGILACRVTPPAAPPPGPSLAPTEAAAAVRSGLESAHRTWSAGDRAAASEQVRQTYATAFEPLEPALRRQDPAGTLRLEYAFGSLASTLAAKGDAVAVTGAVRELVESVEAAARTIPVAQAPAETAAPGSSEITTTPVSPPSAQP